GVSGRRAVRPGADDRRDVEPDDVVPVRRRQPSLSWRDVRVGRDARGAPRDPAPCRVGDDDGAWGDAEGQACDHGAAPRWAHPGAGAQAGTREHYSASRLTTPPNVRGNLAAPGTIRPRSGDAVACNTPAVHNRYRRD